MKIASLAPALVAVLAVGAACRKAPQPSQPPRPTVLGVLPAPPGGYVIDTTGTPDAERRTYSVSQSMDAVAAFYRDKLQKSGFALMSDRADTAGGVADLYATKGKATIWVHVQRNGAAAALATLIGNAGEAAPGTPVPARPR